MPNLLIIQGLFNLENDLGKDFDFENTSFKVQDAKLHVLNSSFVHMQIV